MEYAKLGRTGLDVSRICLGCMSYGGGNRGNHAWSLGEEESRPFIKRALEAGINFFDTANRYSLGSSEEILGRAIKDFARRDEVVIATKVYGRMRPGPNGAGLSRKAIMAEIDASLRRLGTDYVDLYQIHRWDYDTPIEETLEALHDVVKAGKARYIGASSMHAWQFARALGIAERHGWTRFVSMQNLVNLLYREEEREMLPLCAAEGIGVIPWSPQARGRLTRDWDYTSIRTETDEAFGRLFAKTEDADRKVVDRVAQVAAARGIPRAQVALAWLLAKPVITAPIVGATKLHHLDDALASVDVKLSGRRDRFARGAVCAARGRRLCLRPVQEATHAVGITLVPLSVGFCGVIAGRGYCVARPPVCGRERRPIPPAVLDEPANPTATLEVAVLAGGCFWGVQGVFQHVKGVTGAVSGYAGGAANTWHYEMVGTNTTGHARYSAGRLRPPPHQLWTHPAEILSF